MPALQILHCEIDLFYRKNVQSDLGYLATSGPAPTCISRLAICPDIVFVANYHYKIDIEWNKTEILPVLYMYFCFEQDFMWKLMKNRQHWKIAAG